MNTAKQLSEELRTKLVLEADRTMQLKVRSNQLKKQLLCL
jgi:hypothetical protein